MVPRTSEPRSAQPRASYLITGAVTMHAVILAGGKGARLRPYTSVIPKPLVPISEDTCVLDIVLRQLAANGFRSVTLAIGTHGPLIRSFAGDGNRWGLSIDYTEEQTPLGTIGPLLPILHRLPERFLVMNGDVLTDLDYSRLLRHHTQSGAPLTVATCTRESRIDFGVIAREDGRIVSFDEKPTLTHDVSMGVFALSRSAVARYKPPLGFDELVIDLLARGDNPVAFHWNGYWLDIGRPEDYERANSDFPRVQQKLVPTIKQRSYASAAMASGTVLVLGSRGFLGTHVADALARRANLRIIRSGRRIGELDANQGTIELDILRADPVPLADAISRLAPSVIINCVGATTGSADELYGANVKVPAIIVDAVAQAATGTHLIHLGSAAEYGQGEIDVRIDESTPVRPASLYGSTKLAGSAIVLDAARTGRVAATVLRIFNAIGPGSPRSSLAGRLVAELCSAQATREPVRVGPLNATRDFVDVRDAADAVVDAAEAATAGCHVGEVLNVARGEAIPVRTLVDNLLRIADYTGDVQVESETAGQRHRSARVDWQCADISRIEAELGWRPRRSISETLRDMWESKTAP